VVYIFYAPYIFFYFLSSMENGKETRNTKHNIQHSTFNTLFTVHSTTLPGYPGTVCGTRVLYGYRVLYYSTTRYSMILYPYCTCI
jgi:hypothetical protein